MAYVIILCELFYEYIQLIACVRFRNVQYNKKDYYIINAIFDF